MEHSTYCSNEITELAKAMLKVQAELQPALKDRENSFSRSRYATLNSVMEACREILVRNGIWLVQHPVPVEAEYLGLVSKLVHTESGQWQSSLMIMPLPKSDPQGYGSALTYGRRYGLSTLIGIVTEEDDDGEGAKLPANSASPSIRAGNGSQMRKCLSDKPEHGGASKTASNALPESASFAALPKIDGITYQAVTAQDGRPCIIASGNTQAKKALLTGAGFTWSKQRNMWWKYEEAGHAAKHN